MEYEVLGIPEHSSLDEAKAALNRVRIKNHPDKLVNMSRTENEKAAVILAHAESAYKRIKKLKMVDDTMNAMKTIMPQFGPQFGGFNMNSLFDNIGENRQTESYSYQNFNGNVKERGTINGKEMTREELEEYKNTVRNNKSAKGKIRFL